MAGLDLAAGYRPSVPANKKKRTSAYGSPEETATPADPRIAELSPFDAETLRRGNATGYYARPESSIRRIADDIFKREQAEISYPSTDAGIIDFRNRQAARDRAAGLNIGNRTGGQGINPMMPGAAGMGTGPSNTNYGGQGARTNYFINRENVGNEDPRTTERQSGLLEPLGNVPNTAANRIAAMKFRGGIQGAADDGLLDRYVSNDSTLSRMMPDDLRDAMARKRMEEVRKADKLGDIKNPDDIAARLRARGFAKGAERDARMAARQAGGSGSGVEGMLIQAAMNGNPNAIPLLGMIAQGNRETAVERLSGQNKMELGELNANTAKYGYDAQKESALATNKSNETIQGMRDESAQLDRLAELAKNQGNNELLIAVQKSKDELAVKLAELQNATTLNIAEREERDRQRDYDFEREQYDYGRSPEGQIGGAIRAGGLTLEGRPSVDAYIDKAYGGDGNIPTPPLEPGQELLPGQLEQAINSVSHLPTEEQMKALEEKGYTRSQILDEMESNTPGIKDQISSQVPNWMRWLPGNILAERTGLMSSPDIAQWRIAEQRRRRERMRQLLGR